MRNIPFLLWVLLLVDGVSNEENVSRKEGESVTLKPGEIKEDDIIQWWFDGKIIAKMNKEDKFHKTYPGPEDKFKDRLKLDNQTGSLTIINISAKHAGVYKLQIKGKNETFTSFSVTVQVYKSMTEGDSFPLVIDVKQVDKIQWKFGDQVIPTDRLNPDEKWRNIRLNNKTGDLTIEHIRRDQSGVYKAEINSSSPIVLLEFHITVEIIQIMPVMKGDSVTLNTYSEIQRDDLTIMWMFGEESTRIAEINREAKKTLYEDVLDGRFRGRLKLDRTGSLTITNTKTTDEGLYTVRISSSNRETKNKRFVVTVKDPGWSSGAVAGIVVGVLLLLLLLLLVGFIIAKRIMN